MKPKSSGCILLFLCLFLAGTGFAQDQSLVEKFKKELLPQKLTPGKNVYEVAAKGVGGATTSSVIMHLKFKINSYNLTPRAFQVLQALGQALQDQSLNHYVYKIEGHTCNLGNENDNLLLSKNRAETVGRFLVENFGFPREMFKTEGYGESQPVTSNDTENGRQENRRVVVMNTHQELQVPVSSQPEIAFKVKYTRARQGEQELRQGATLTNRDNYCVEFTPKSHAYVYIYQVDSTGKKSLLFPNPKFFRAGNPVEAGKLYRIPEFGRWLYLDENKGQENIIVIAQKENIRNPDEVCQTVLEEDYSNMHASIPKVAFGIREREDIQMGTQETVKPETSIFEEPAAADNRQSDKQPDVLSEPPADMSKVFRWKLSFMHQ
ncbi:MAG: OmpA family protein [Desulfobacterales bacterium]|nr:OmpA family protein [Desulfobacterales bacterium]